MKIQNSIQQKLERTFNPSHLEVTNESHMHNVPPNSESHFKVVIVSDLFDGKMLIARHRLINEALKEELDGQIHALALHTLTSDEWDVKQQHVLSSPPCHGGGGAK